MPNYEVVGYRPYAFDSKDGGRVEGVSLFCIVDGSTGVTGRQVEKLNLSDKRLDELGYYPKVGDLIVPYFNKYGKVEAIANAEV